MTPTRVVQFGLGKLGRDIARGYASRSDLELVAAVDPAKEVVGRSLRELLGPGAPELTVLSGGPVPDADVAAVVTGSRLESVGPHIAELVDRGVNVITSCEELGYPWREFPEWSRRLDDAARAAGVSVLGVGANPGFVMDTLPLVLSATIQELESVSVTRTMDLRPHRQERLDRFGFGRTPEEFDRMPTHVRHGHIGFRQSMDCLADHLGWELTGFHEQPLEPVVIAEAARRGDQETIEPGTVACVRQSIRGYVDGRDVIELTEFFGFALEPDDPVPFGDTHVLAGRDQSFTVRADPGYQAFPTTPAIMINLTGPLVRAPAGLRTAMEFAAADLASKRRGRALVAGGAPRPPDDQIGP
jgi:2,4-diaminopentanoate dehydrogenase